MKRALVQECALLVQKLAILELAVLQWHLRGPLVEVLRR